MIVVSGTSPLNYLVLIGQVEVLPVLFGRIVAPPAVIAEMQHPGAPSPVREWAAAPPSWLEEELLKRDAERLGESLS